MNEEIREREEEAEPGISRVLFMLGFVAFSQAVVMNSLDPERFLQSKHNFLSRVYLTFAFYSFKETSWGLRTFRANFICELFEKRLYFLITICSVLCNKVARTAAVVSTRAHILEIEISA